MRIGIVGAGKLGLPVALAIQDKGHDVLVYDVSPEVQKTIESRELPYQEVEAPELLKRDGLKTGSLQDVVAHSEIIFCAVQTPHELRFEGIGRLPNDRADFDYTYLKKAVSDIASEAKRQKKRVVLVVISTCLPGTFRKHIKPLLNQYVDYVYNPFFIAMGTVISDFLNPEFVLLGYDNDKSPNIVHNFYNTIHDKTHFPTDITTAEAIKVSYNTFITMKTVLANTWGEIAHKVGANIDDIYRAWSLATDRLISPKYLKSGMGDGGGCHPRDNIALSWLAEDIGLSHNLFEDLMKSREDHAEWLADLAVDVANRRSLPLILLGRSFKPRTKIETGSPAILVANIIREKHDYEPIHVENLRELKKATYLLTTQHKRYLEYDFPTGSVVIDPFGTFADKPGIKVMRIGRP